MWIFFFFFWVLQDVLGVPRPEKATKIGKIRESEGVRYGFDGGGDRRAMADFVLIFLWFGLWAVNSSVGS